jgi:3-hydroxyacyl-CoA dehydrogenase/enoyl-CoA hydratase/3-hydroxybutyryl-CoA epimerase
MEEITNRLVLRLLNESVSCVREQVVADKDLLDAGMIFGTGFAPFRGGPMHYLDAIGATALQQQLKTLRALRGDRFKPDQGWEAFINSSGGETT